MLENKLYWKNGRPRLDLTPLENTAVNVPTQEMYDMLMMVYETAGWKWKSSKLPTERNYWKKYKQNTCISAGKSYQQSKRGSEVFVSDNNGNCYREGNFGWNNKEFYNNQGWNIIKPDSHEIKNKKRILIKIGFYEHQEINKKDREDIYNWFEKHKPNRATKGER